MSKSLFLDLYELTMAQVYFKFKRDSFATFELFIRSFKRPFYIAAGIDEALNFLENFKFSKEDIDYLRDLNLFEEDFLKYLTNFKFNGDVWAVEEPEIVFANEPIITVRGNLIEAQLAESILLNKINLATTLATKAFRVVLSSKDKSVYDFSLRRTQGENASLAIAKYSYIVGAKGTSNVLAGYLYKIPVVGTMAHSFIMSFEREKDAFLAFAKTFPEKTILLLDTYDVKNGIRNAIDIAKFLKYKGFQLFGIRLDSGNLITDSKYIRGLLDKEGLLDTIILASGNLDEFKIKKILQKNPPIDAFGVGTNMGCSSDLPFTDVLYKLVEIKEGNKNFIPTMKFSKNKITLPSKKQVVRIFRKNIMEKDLIVLDDENIEGKELLKKVMEAGKRLYKEKDIEEKRKIFLEKSNSLPDYLKDINPNRKYPVLISKKIFLLIDKLKNKLKTSIPKIIFFDIDTQNDFIDKSGALYVKGSEKIIKNLKILTEFAKKNNILIISSQDTHIKNDPEFKDFPQHCIDKTWGNKKLNETLLPKNKIKTIGPDIIYDDKSLEDIILKFKQIILQKNVLDVFSNPNTINILKSIYPDKVYVYGVVTEYCVEKAVAGLLKNNFKVCIIKDAIKEISVNKKRELFLEWKKQGVEFIKTKDLIKKLFSF